MKSKQAFSTLSSMALIEAFVLFAPDVLAASAKKNTVVFHGRLVNAGCEARVLTAPTHSYEHKSLKLNAYLTLELVKHDDACEGAAIPVSTFYIERTSTVFGPRSGIVTLTYQ
ncbi:MULTISPECIES: hypothetical protein [unclassified Pseudomonas]|uniref:hypothetical protein n=1 Tax=unclassified Pseudomonas TaxID=196821 RepID=UPI0025D3FFC6|nr:MULTISPECIES: hypothetical protein [unclassified Pseudomonas]